MTPWIELARKLSLFDLMVKRYTPTTGFFLALVDFVPRHLQHLVGDEVLAGSAGVDDGLDQILGHIPVVHQHVRSSIGLSPRIAT